MVLPLLILLAGSSLSRADLQCDNTTLHEVPDCRFPCPPQRTCQNFRGPEPPCVPPSKPCTPQCVCADGYARNRYGGTCVTYEQCDKCPGNNQYFDCDGPYSENCCGSCHCADGYARNASDVCVSTTPPPPVVNNPPPPPPPPVVQPTSTPVPNPNLQCDNTTEVPACLYDCPGQRTCNDYRAPEPPCLPSTKPCTPQCVCATGYARNGYGGPCVTHEECDIILSQLTCDNATRHEVRACVTGCPPARTCLNHNWGPLPCNPRGYPCDLKCICADGYARNDLGDGRCITIKQCDKCPGENEYFQCDGDYSEDCVGRCYCTPNHVRNSYNKCVYVNPRSPPVTIDPPVKPEDLHCDNVTRHEVPDCPDECPPLRTCQNFRDPQYPCVPPSKPCTPQCVCADGFARNQYGGTCVTFDQCDKCPGNNQYFACDGPYSETCAGSCHCADGYARNASDVCVSTTPAPVHNNSTPPPVVVQPSPPVPEPSECSPPPPVTCDNATKHEIPACGYGCPPELTCQNRNWPPFPCAPPAFPCTPKCICADGYARNREDGTCITLEQCDKCPGIGQYFACDGPYSENCTYTCHCLPGYERDANNCVSVAPTPPPHIYYPPPPPYLQPLQPVQPGYMSRAGE